MEKDGPIKLDYNEKNKFTHLYTLQLKADGTYEVWFDEVSKASGVILEDWPFPAALAIPIPKDKTKGTVTGPVVTAPQSHASPSTERRFGSSQAYPVKIITGAKAQ